MAVDSLITAICGMVGSSDAPNGSTLDCAAIGFRRDLNKVKRSNGGVIGFTFPRFFVVARRRPSSRARLTALFRRDQSLSQGMPAVVGRGSPVVRTPRNASAVFYLATSSRRAVSRLIGFKTGKRLDGLPKTFQGMPFSHRHVPRQHSNARTHTQC